MHQVMHMTSPRTTHGFSTSRRRWKRALDLATIGESHLGGARLHQVRPLLVLLLFSELLGNSDFSKSKGKFNPYVCWQQEKVLRWIKIPRSNEQSIYVFLIRFQYLSLRNQQTYSSGNRTHFHIAMLDFRRFREFSFCSTLVLPLEESVDFAVIPQGFHLHFDQAWLTITGTSRAKTQSLWYVSVTVCFRDNSIPPQKWPNKNSRVEGKKEKLMKTHHLEVSLSNPFLPFKPEFCWVFIISSPDSSPWNFPRREPPATVVETSIPLPVWSARRIRSGCGPRGFGEEAAGFKALE